MTVTQFGSLEWPGHLDLCPDSLYLKLTNKDPEELLLAFKKAKQSQPLSKIAPLE